MLFRSRCQGGWGMRVLYHDVYKNEKAENELGARQVDLDTLLREADFVSVHTDLNEKTRGMFNATAFKKMKRTAVFVNHGTAAGSEIVAAALQEHGRARILGTPTSGSGTSQAIFPLTDDAALRLITSRPHVADRRHAFPRTAGQDVHALRARGERWRDGTMGIGCSCRGGGPGAIRPTRALDHRPPHLVGDSVRGPGAVSAWLRHRRVPRRWPVRRRRAYAPARRYVAADRSARQRARAAVPDAHDRGLVSDRAAQIGRAHV